MKLLLRRSQKKGLIGGSITFRLHARAELTDEESANVNTYKMGGTILYSNIEERASGLIGRLAQAAMGIEIRVNDLIHGKQVDCHDIVEMIAVEAQIREACKNFKQVLDTAAQFGGEEVVEF